MFRRRRTPSETLEEVSVSMLRRYLDPENDDINHIDLVVDSIERVREAQRHEFQAFMLADMWEA